ncbi:MAG: hypothetical protein ABI612_02245 [Betaproteobacteria bacterium]
MLAFLTAIALTVGLTPVQAQNVDSAKAKAQGEEKTMKDKEAGAKGTGKPGQTQANKKAGQSNAGQAEGQSKNPGTETGKTDSNGTQKPKQE